MPGGCFTSIQGWQRLFRIQCAQFTEQRARGCGWFPGQGLLPGFADQLAKGLSVWKVSLPQERGQRIVAAVQQRRTPCFSAMMARG